MKQFCYLIESAQSLAQSLLVFMIQQVCWIWVGGFNHFLIHVQRNKQHMYKLMGDGVYGLGFLECVRSYFWAPLTPEKSYCNAKLKACHQSLEWSYGDISKLFSICDKPNAYMIGKKESRCYWTVKGLPQVSLHSQLFNGGKASGHNMFCCTPPTLEEYLRL